MSPLLRNGLTASAVVLAFAAGTAVHAPKTLGATKVVRVSVPTPVPVPGHTVFKTTTVPKACLTALAQADVGFTNAGTGLDMAQSAFQAALTDGDVSKLLAANPAVAAAASTVARAAAPYKAAAAECRNAAK